MDHRYERRRRKAPSQAMFDYQSYSERVEDTSIERNIQRRQGSMENGAAMPSSSTSSQLGDYYDDDFSLGGSTRASSVRHGNNFINDHDHDHDEDSFTPLDMDRNGGVVDRELEINSAKRGLRNERKKRMPSATGTVSTVSTSSTGGLGSSSTHGSGKNMTTLPTSTFQNNANDRPGNNAEWTFSNSTNNSNDYSGSHAEPYDSNYDEKVDERLGIHDEWKLLPPRRFENENDSVQSDLTHQHEIAENGRFVSQPEDHVVYKPLKPSEMSLDPVHRARQIRDAMIHRRSFHEEYENTSDGCYSRDQASKVLHGREREDYEYAESVKSASSYEQNGMSETNTREEKYLLRQSHDNDNDDDESREMGRMPERRRGTFDEGNNLFDELMLDSNQDISTRESSNFVRMNNGQGAHPKHSNGHNELYEDDHSLYSSYQDSHELRKKFSDGAHDHSSNRQDNVDPSINDIDSLAFGALRGNTRGQYERSNMQDNSSIGTPYDDRINRYPDDQKMRGFTDDAKWNEHEEIEGVHQELEEHSQYSFHGDDRHNSISDKITSDGKGVSGHYKSKYNNVARAENQRLSKYRSAEDAGSSFGDDRHKYPVDPSTHNDNKSIQYVSSLKGHTKVRNFSRELPTQDATGNDALNNIGYPSSNGKNLGYSTDEESLVSRRAGMNQMARTQAYDNVRETFDEGETNGHPSGLTIGSKIVNDTPRPFHVDENDGEKDHCRTNFDSVDRGKSYYIEKGVADNYQRRNSGKSAQHQSEKEMEPAANDSIARRSAGNEFYEMANGNQSSIQGNGPLRSPVDNMQLELGDQSQQDFNTNKTKKKSEPNIVRRTSIELSSEDEIEQVKMIFENVPARIGADHLIDSSRIDNMRNDHDRQARPIRDIPFADKKIDQRKNTDNFRDMEDEKEAQLYSGLKSLKPSMTPPVDQFRMKQNEMTATMSHELEGQQDDVNRTNFATEPTRIREGEIVKRISNDGTMRNVPVITSKVSAKDIQRTNEYFDLRTNAMVAKEYSQPLEYKTKKIVEGNTIKKNDVFDVIRSNDHMTNSRDKPGNTATQKKADLPSSNRPVSKPTIDDFNLDKPIKLSRKVRKSKPAQDKVATSVSLAIPDFSAPRKKASNKRSTTIPLDMDKTNLRKNSQSEGRLSDASRRRNGIDKTRNGPNALLHDYNGIKSNRITQKVGLRSGSNMPRRSTEPYDQASKQSIRNHADPALESFDRNDLENESRMARKSTDPYIKPYKRAQNQSSHSQSNRRSAEPYKSSQETSSQVDLQSEPQFSRQNTEPYNNHYSQPQSQLHSDRQRSDPRTGSLEPSDLKLRSDPLTSSLETVDQRTYLPRRRSTECLSELEVPTNATPVRAARARRSTMSHVSESLPEVPPAARSRIPANDDFSIDDDSIVDTRFDSLGYSIDRKRHTATDRDTRKRSVLDNSYHTADLTSNPRKNSVIDHSYHSVDPTSNPRRNSVIDHSYHTADPTSNPRKNSVIDHSYHTADTTYDSRKNSVIDDHSYHAGLPMGSRKNQSSDKSYHTADPTFTSRDQYLDGDRRVPASGTNARASRSNDSRRHKSMDFSSRRSSASANERRRATVSHVGSNYDDRIEGRISEEDDTVVGSYISGTKSKRKDKRHGTSSSRKTHSTGSSKPKKIKHVEPGPYKRPGAEYTSAPSKRSIARVKINLDSWLEHCREPLAIQKVTERRQRKSGVGDGEREDYRMYRDNVTNLIRNESKMMEREYKMMIERHRFKKQEVKNSVILTASQQMALMSGEMERQKNGQPQGKKKRSNLKEDYKLENAILSQQSFPKDIFKIISLLPGNERCVDCGDKFMDRSGLWATISFGCLLCKECAFRHVTHEKKHKQEEKLKPINDGNWTFPEIVSMLEGGNRVFIEHIVGSKSKRKNTSLFGNRVFEESMLAKAYNGKAASSYRKVHSRNVESSVGNRKVES